MAQGEGYWYNPKLNLAIKIHRHEIDLKEPSLQKKLQVPHSATEALKSLSLSPDNEDKIKMVGIRVGLVRIRDWQKFLSIQFYARGNQAKDILFSLAELIEAHQNKDYSGLSPDTKGFAKLIGSSWTLRLDNLDTRESDSLSPSQFLKKYSEEGYMEEKKKKKDEEPINEGIRDIPMSQDLVEDVNNLLKKYNYFREEEVDNLFHDPIFFLENKRYSSYEEDLTLSRVWKLANDGKHIFAIITAHRQTNQDNQDEINFQRNKSLEKILRKLNYGYNKIDGYWVEIGQDSQSVNNLDAGKEASFFVSVSIPENEISKGMEGKTVTEFRHNISNLLDGDSEEDNTVPSEQDIIHGKTGFNQDAAAIKLDPKDKNIYLIDRKQDFFPLGEIEFFKDVRNVIKKLPKDVFEKLASGAGGIAFSELVKRKGSGNKGGTFRAGKLKKGE